MPKTKNSNIRIKVTDRCIRKGEYSTKQLIKALNDEFELLGIDDTVASANTERYDMK